MKEKIERWYKQGLWTEAMVRNAGKKGIISDADADEIIGVASKTA